MKDLVPCRGIIKNFSAISGAVSRAGAMSQTLYDKLWNAHVVHSEDDGTALIYIDRHLVHEVTSPQAFEGLELAGRKVWRLNSILATADRVEIVFHFGCEVVIDQLRQMDFEQLRHGERGPRGHQRVPFLHDVLTRQNRVDNRGVGTRATDAHLFERCHIVTDRGTADGW